MNQIEDKAKEYTLQLFDEQIPANQDILIWLKERLFYLLNNDFNALVNLLYRIDVYESKAKECFSKSNEAIADCLAKLIWERQMEKAKRRFGN